MGSRPGARRVLDARRAGALSAARRACAAALVLAVACTGLQPGAPVLRVGTSGDYPPFSQSRAGGFEGLDVDVARRFARDAGRRLELVALPWPDLVREVAAGRVDLAMGGVTMRPERAVAGVFTRPVLQTGALVLVRPATAHTAAEIDRPAVRLAVNAGGHLERVAHRLFPHATLLVTPENGALAGFLQRGQADAVLTDDAEAAALAPELPVVERIGPLTRDRKAYLGRDPALVATLDAWLRRREADGMLAALRGRWLGPAWAAPRATSTSDLEALAALVDLRLAFMPAVAAAKEAAGLPITDPAQEERVLGTVCAQAAAAGLAPEPVEALFRAQIAAARGVQQAFLATPPGSRPPVDRLDLAEQARPALAGLSTTIVARAADLAADRAALARLDAGTVADLFDPALPARDRLAIARAVLALAPAAPPARDSGP